MEVNEPVLQMSVKIKWNDEAGTTKDIIVTADPLTVSDFLNFHNAGLELKCELMERIEELGLKLKETLSKEKPPYILIKPVGIDVATESLKSYTTDIFQGKSKVTGTRVEVEGEGPKREIKSITFFLRHSESK